MIDVVVFTITGHSHRRPCQNRCRHRSSPPSAKIPKQNPKRLSPLNCIAITSPLHRALFIGLLPKVGLRW
ncbi:hypothetical protein GW17_00019691 [Ensete ventricosum]|nr:hypothetical protein GW17_00019691 [Ensete ventricosum]